MKQDTHPQTHTAQITCSCGATYAIGNSTFPELQVEICGKCHPHYTGKQKVVDTAGRVDKFNARMAKAQQKVG